MSIRTIMRDVEALSTAGVPVYCERGPHGGIAMMPGFRSDLTGLTDDEMGAVFLSVGTARSSQLGLQAPLASALRKLTAALPAQRRDAAFRLGSRIVVDPNGWLPGPHVPWLGEARHAVMAQATVRILYQSYSAGQTKWVNTLALGLLCAANTWYLVGFSGATARFFRLDRIDELEMSSTFASVPSGFDVESCWNDARARFRQRFTPMKATLSLSLSALAQLRGLCSIISVTPERRADHRRVIAEFGDLSHATEVLPRIATSLRVLEPRALRDAIRNLGRQLLHATGEEVDDCDNVLTAFDASSLPRRTNPKKKAPSDRSKP